MWVKRLETARIEWCPEQFASRKTKNSKTRLDRVAQQRASFPYPFPEGIIAREQQLHESGHSETDITKITKVKAELGVCLEGGRLTTEEACNVLQNGTLAWTGVYLLGREQLCSHSVLHDGCGRIAPGEVRPFHTQYVNVCIHA